MCSQTAPHISISSAHLSTHILQADIGSRYSISIATISNAQQTNRTAARMSSNQVQCLVCWDDVPRQSTITYNGNQVTCVACAEGTLVPMFEAAIDREQAYRNLLVGGGRLNPDEFKSVLGAEFIERFRSVEEEYKTPSNNRVYCPHMIKSNPAPPRGSQTSGARALHPNKIATADRDGVKTERCSAFVCQGRDHPTVISCYQCSGALCGRCGKAHHSFSERATHALRDDCLPSTTEADSPTGTNIRTQRCPGSCQEIYAQADGCNHVVCQADGTNWCFHCGQVASDESGHWTLGTGTCPRWPAPEGASQYDFDGSPRHFDERGVPLPRYMQSVNDSATRWFINGPLFRSIFTDGLRVWQHNMPAPSWVARVPDQVEFVADVPIEGGSGEFIGLIPYGQRLTTAEEVRLSRLEDQIREYFVSPVVWHSVVGPVSGAYAMFSFVFYGHRHIDMRVVNMYGALVDEDDEHDDSEEDFDSDADVTDEED